MAGYINIITVNPPANEYSRICSEHFKGRKRGVRMILLQVLHGQRPQNLGLLLKNVIIQLLHHLHITVLE